MAIAFTPLPIPSDVAGRLVGNSILITITVLVVALRYVARLVTGSKLGWDDYLILAAVPQMIGLLIIQGLCESLQQSPGHDNEFDPRDLSPSYRLAH